MGIRAESWKLRNIILHSLALSFFVPDFDRKMERLSFLPGFCNLSPKLHINITRILMMQIS